MVAKNTKRVQRIEAPLRRAKRKVRAQHRKHEQKQYTKRKKPMMVNDCFQLDSVGPVAGNSGAKTELVSTMLNEQFENMYRKQETKECTIFVRER